MRPSLVAFCAGVLPCLAGMSVAEEWSVIDAPIKVRGEMKNIVPERQQVQVM